MKYSELISFHPIEDTIQLITAKDSALAKGYVESYVMSDAMAGALQVPVIDQLQMDEVVDNKGVLVVGNYGTGKSHLMSVISSVALDADNLQYLQNRKFAEQMKPIAGKFEVLRIEIGGVTMPLRDIIFGYIEEDFDARGIAYTAPDFATVRDNKKLIRDMMAAFASKYPDKGYLIVIDELLNYLKSRDERQIVLDLEFFRAMGEMCSKSKLRLIAGVQETIFDNPKFSFVSETLRHVSDRFTQQIISKEAISYVVSERLLKKTPEQKALIRSHLEKFASLYTGMSSRMEEFVDLFPIHPAYFDVFNKVFAVEQRHILRNISLTIKNVFDTDVPDNAPGIFSFDTYWPVIKSNGILRSDVTIGRVVNASSQLEDIINRAYSRPALKPIAIQIIYALSVHRLTTHGLDVQFGMTAENLKDDLCLYLKTPEQTSDFLLGAVNATLRAIMTAVSGQFIMFNEANNQYYIDVDKVIDYDEKIKQKASVLATDELNQHFYKVVYRCLEWDARPYVNGYEIYQHDLNWDSHHIYREGYFFMGLPCERSTAQPERDFYIHILPPYSATAANIQNLPDEVYLSFKSTQEFKDTLELYAAAMELANISEGKDKTAYLQKAEVQRKKLVKYLGENKSTCFDVTYKGQHKQMSEVLNNRYNRDMTFNEAIDLTASILLDEYFTGKYPEYPVFEITITRNNEDDNARAGVEHYLGRRATQSRKMLQSFGLLDEDKVRPDHSKYASYYINLLRSLPPQGVLNYSDLFDAGFSGEYYDKRFRISYKFTPIIFLSLVYAGYAVLTLKDGKTLSAATLEDSRFYTTELREFKYLSRPAAAPMAELKRMYEVLGIEESFLDNPAARDKGIEKLLKTAQELRNEAVIANRDLSDNFELWGEPLASPQKVSAMKSAASAVLDEFSNYSARFNSFPKLSNFRLTIEEIDKLDEQIRTMHCVREFMTFKAECSAIVTYLSAIEAYNLGESLQTELTEAKNHFRTARESVANGATGRDAAGHVNGVLTRIKERYITLYFEEHKKKRLDVNDTRRRGKILESKQLARLKKLRTVEILSSSKLAQIEQDLTALKSCFELTPEKLKTTPICPTCHFSLNDHAKNVYGQMDNIEDRLNSLESEWTNTLLDTITSDPTVTSQMEYLSEAQQNVINDFIAAQALPERVDDFFIGAVAALLQGFEPVVIDVNDLLQHLEALPPMDTAAFQRKVQELISGYTLGKDLTKVRIMVKHCGEAE